ncbi:unnamed protein product [Choristocarpus tenellus]
MGLPGMGITLAGMHAHPSQASYVDPRLLQHVATMGLPLRLPAEASQTLYVEGVPSDASEREIAHIFRPFPGFLSIRLRVKGGRGGGGGISPIADTMCFVEFESAYHATVAKLGATNYRLDKADRHSPSLRIAYAKPPRNRDGRGGGVGDRDRDRDRDRERDRDRDRGNDRENHH